MAIGLVGRKCGMTRIFTDVGVSIPVTLIWIEPNRITQIKTPLRDGYCALQITAMRQKSSNLSKPLIGHYAKAGVEAGKGLWEFRIAESEIQNYQVGDELSLTLYQVGQKVTVSGTSKGKGFAGTIKRYNYRSQDATHGNSLSHRKLGSTGMNQSPGRVFPGKGMPGQLGNENVTVKNKEIIFIDIQRGFLFIKGAVPGATNSIVIVLPLS